MKYTTSLTLRDNLAIDSNRQRLWNFLSFLSSRMKSMQPAKKKVTRMQGEQNRTTSLKRVMTVRSKHNSQRIVPINNGSQPTSKVI